MELEIDYNRVVISRNRWIQDLDVGEITEVTLLKEDAIKLSEILTVRRDPGIGNLAFFPRKHVEAGTEIIELHVLGTEVSSEMVFLFDRSVTSIHITESHTASWSSSVIVSFLHIGAELIETIPKVYQLRTRMT